MATHWSVLAWGIPGTGEPGGLPSLGSHRVRHDWSDLAVAAFSPFWFSLCYRRYQLLLPTSGHCTCCIFWGFSFLHSFSFIYLLNSNVMSSERNFLITWSRNFPFLSMCITMVFVYHGHVFISFIVLCMLLINLFPCVLIDCMLPSLKCVFASLLNNSFLSQHPAHGRKSIIAY